MNPENIAIHCFSAVFVVFAVVNCLFLGWLLNL